MSAMRACSSAASIMDGGLLGGGYGPTRILPTTPPSHSLTPAIAAANTANQMDSLGDCAPSLANAVAAAVPPSVAMVLTQARLPMAASTADLRHPVQNLGD